MPTSIDPLPGENEFECARCGAIFHYELTRCPHCGVNLYEPDDDEQRPQSGRFARTGWSAGLVEGLRRLFRKPHAAEELFSASLRQAQLFNDLLAASGGDRDLVERLVAYEKRQNPEAGRSSWLAGAIRRLDHDRRNPGR